MHNFSARRVVAFSLLLVLMPGVSLGEQQAGAAVKSLVIPAAAANGETQEADYRYDFGVGRYVAGDGCHIAPAYLPHGGVGMTVTVTEFTAYAIDFFAGNTTYKLWRKEINSDALPEVMATVTHAKVSQQVEILHDNSIDNPVVTSNHTYFIRWCWAGLNQALGVQGFTISYTETEN